MQKKEVYTVEEARKKLENYCAYQERCHQEVTQKLLELKMIPQAIDKIIGHLIEFNFLNETRFAKAFARGKFRIKKWGRHRIKRELKMKNISSFNIDIALNEISDEDYDSTLNVLVEKFWKTYDNRTSVIQYKKVVDALIYRGWEYPLIYKAIQQLKEKLDAQ